MQLSRSKRRVTKSEKATREGGAELEPDPLKLCLQVAESIGSKADKNKSRARALTLFTTSATAAIPVFIGLSGDSFVAGKVVPSILAAVSAIIVAIGQIERPHERWSLYRRYERLLQAASKRYVYRISPFDGDDRDEVLGAQVAQYELDLQAEWEGLIPSSSELATATQKRLNL